MIPHFIIDGTIACGKTTLLETLGCLEKIVVQKEPIEKWTSMMDKYYTDPCKYAHQVNRMCLRDLARRDAGSVDDHTVVIVSERSVHSSYHVFGKLTLEQGYITPAELAELQQDYHTMGSNEYIGYLFIDVDADVAIQRMEKRKRSEVLSKDKEYFVRLVEVYRRFYRGLEEAGANVVWIDGHRDASDVVSQVLNIIEPYKSVEKNYLK